MVTRYLARHRAWGTHGVLTRPGRGCRQRTIAPSPPQAFPANKERRPGALSFLVWRRMPPWPAHPTQHRTHVVQNRLSATNGVQHASIGLVLYKAPLACSPDT